MQEQTRKRIAKPGVTVYEWPHRRCKWRLRKCTAPFSWQYRCP